MAAGRMFGDRIGGAAKPLLGPFRNLIPRVLVRLSDSDSDFGSPAQVTNLHVAGIANLLVGFRLRRDMRGAEAGKCNGQRYEHWMRLLFERPLTPAECQLWVEADCSREGAAQWS